MEISADMELQNIRNELTQGRELVKQLQIHLNAPSSSQEVCGFLINKIIESYEKALTMVKYNGHFAEGETTTAPALATGTPESPPALNIASPTNLQDYDMELLDHDRNNGSSNRKDTPRWRKQVQIYPVTVLEGPLDDGYSWRKYGQKDILGAKYPRGYYRCTHRHTKGCLATKQVQRSDDDPTIVEVTYRGTHTCNQSINSKLPSATPDQNQEFNVGGDHHHHKLLEPQPQEDHQQAQSSNFQPGLKIITEDSDTQAQSFPYSFKFPSPSSFNHIEHYAFSPRMIDNNFRPPILPPILAGSNHSPLTSREELTGMASATTSATNSPTLGIDLPFSSMGFGSNFNSENPGSFS